MKLYYEIIWKNGKQYQLFLVLCVYLYISNPYIIEAKVICNKTAVFIYYWRVLRIVHYDRGNHSKNDQIPSHQSTPFRQIFIPST